MHSIYTYREARYLKLQAATQYLTYKEVDLSFGNFWISILVQDSFSHSQTLIPLV
jgi:hypothetical protein